MENKISITEMSEIGYWYVPFIPLQVTEPILDNTS